MKPTHLVLLAAPLGARGLSAPVTIYAMGPVRILCAGCMEPMDAEHARNGCGATGGDVD